MKTPAFIALLMLAQYLTLSIHGSELDGNLVLRLRFDESSNVDNNLFFTGEGNPDGITYSNDSISGSSLDLTSDLGGYVTVINPPEIENNFTISLWVKLPEGNPETLRGVFSWGPENGVEGESHGFFLTAFHEFLTIQSFGSNRQTSRNPSIGTVKLDQWNHIAYTFSPPKFTGGSYSHYLFVNGKNVISNTSGFRTIAYRGNNIILGANPVGGYEVFPGLIDDFRLYNRSLNQTEVQSLIDEQTSSLSIERIDQGSIVKIYNPHNQALEVLATSDFLSWESAHVTSTSKVVEYFFDNLHQGDTSRFYRLGQ